MKRPILLFLLLAAPMYCGAQVTYVTSGDAADHSGTNVASISTTLSSLPAGAAIVVAGYANAAVTINPSDSGGGSFSQVADTTWDSSNNHQMKVWCMANASVGSHTVTLTVSPADAE